jgi:hypothetical protein
MSPVSVIDAASARERVCAIGASTIEHVNGWKLLGLAGLAGVATATGVILARRRTWDEVEPEELRSRLHERLQNSATNPDPL